MSHAVGRPASPLGDLVAILRDGGSSRAKALRLAERAAHTDLLSSHLAVGRRVVVELTKPPPAFRGLRDLRVRRGTPDDLDALTRIDETPPELVRARFARGDLAYVGEIGSRVLCHTWFHRGPSPFTEDASTFASWALDEASYWSFCGAALPEARASGIFVKLFQTALREVLADLGARRVVGFIRDTNGPSLAIHDHLGFARIGTLVSVALPGVRWLRWRGQGATRRWLASAAHPPVIALPPCAPVGPA